MWAAILERKCVMVGNGDSMGFSHDGWARMDLLSCLSTLTGVASN